MNASKSHQDFVDAVIGLAALVVVTAVLMAVPGALPDEMSVGIMWLLSGAFLVSAFLHFIWGCCDRRARAVCWNAGLWRAVWGAELALLTFVAAPIIRQLGFLALALLMTGFYLQSRGTIQLLHRASTHKKSGLAYLAIGLTAMLVSLLAGK